MSGSESTQQTDNSNKGPAAVTTEAARSTEGIDEAALLDDDGDPITTIDAHTEKLLIGPAPAKEGQRTSRNTNSSKRNVEMKLERKVPLHPAFSCKEEKLGGYGGVMFTPQCETGRLIAKDIFEGIPRMVETMPMNGMCTHAHVTSVMLDPRIEPIHKVARILNGAEPYFTVRGWAATIRKFMSSCAHCMSQMGFMGNKLPVFEEEPGLPSVEMYQEAWKLAITGGPEVQGQSIVMGTRKPIVLLPLGIFKHHDGLEFIDADVATYELLEKTDFAVNADSHSHAVIVCPPCMPLHRIRSAVRRVSEFLETQNIKGVLVPSPWSNMERNDEYYSTMTKEFQMVQESFIMQGKEFPLASYFPEDGHVHAVTDVYAVLGIDPRERSKDPLSTHQLQVYFKAVTKLLRNTTTPLPDFIKKGKPTVTTTSNTAIPTETPVAQQVVVETPPTSVTSKDRNDRKRHHSDNSSRREDYTKRHSRNHRDDSRRRRH